MNSLQFSADLWAPDGVHSFSRLRVQMGDVTPEAVVLRRFPPIIIVLKDTFCLAACRGQKHLKIQTFMSKNSRYEIKQDTYYYFYFLFFKWVHRWNAIFYTRYSFHSSHFISLGHVFGLNGYWGGLRSRANPRSKRTKCLRRALWPAGGPQECQIFIIIMLMICYHPKDLTLMWCK